MESVTSPEPSTSKSGGRGNAEAAEAEVLGHLEAEVKRLESMGQSEHAEVLRQMLKSKQAAADDVFVHAARCQVSQLLHERAAGCSVHTDSAKGGMGADPHAVRAV